MAKETEKIEKDIAKQDEKTEGAEAQKAVKKKEKKSQKERPRSKKKHTKVQVWKMYEIKDGKLTRKRDGCPRCGPGTFVASFQNRKYCGKCGWGLVGQAMKAESKEAKPEQAKVKPEMKAKA